MVRDINNKEIMVGSYVRYINTGTKGTVKEIKEIDGEEWVVLDNDLMYKPHILEIIEYSKENEKVDEKELIKRVLEEEELDLSGSLDTDSCGAG